jgi:hypothetical protein
MIMSTRPSILSTFPDAFAVAAGAVEQRQIGFACVVGVAWVSGFGSPDAPAMRPEAEPREVRAVDVEPQVYCRRHGAEHAAKGFAPCSDLGCAGCTRPD